jgi:hypothetical protein
MAGRMICMYELSSSVGRGTANSSRSDIMLVQYFLFSIYIGTKFKTSFEIQSTALNPAALFPTNGIFTPDLVAWIVTFQQDANQKGFGPLVADGRIDPGKAAWGIRQGRSTSHKTIMALNQVLVNADGDTFERLTDPNMSTELRSLLSVANSRGL